MVVTTWKSSHFSGSPSFILKERLKSLKKNIKVWKEKYWNVGQKEVQEAKADMLRWDLLAEQMQLSHEEVMILKSARANYHKAEEKLSLSLKQRSRVKWAVEGDENSRFFHSLIKGRLKRNTIKGIIVNGLWVEEPAQIKDGIFHFFSKQFREPRIHRPGF